MARDDADYGNLYSAPFQQPDCENAASTRKELIDGNALQQELLRLKEEHGRDAWMDDVPMQSRTEWTPQEHSLYKTHQTLANQLRTALEIDQKAGPPDARGERTLLVSYSKGEIGMGRRVASYPSMQHCPSPLRRALLRKTYHDVDMVSAHPTLMLQVVRKMVEARAIRWSGALNKLVEYAELDDNRFPAGRLPMLQRIAEHFGINRASAKEVCKPLVLRVLNGGQVRAWCEEMGIAMPAVEQADLRDLTEVARIVREAFFAMLERDHPGRLESLQEMVKAKLRDEHERQVQDARRKRERPPQPKSEAAIERAMFSACMFELEASVLDCIDVHLREQGWTVASLVYDGVSAPRSNRPWSGRFVLPLICP